MLPEELILMHIMYRNDSDCSYFVKQDQEEKEFKVEKGNSLTYALFFSSF